MEKILIILLLMVLLGGCVTVAKPVESTAPTTGAAGKNTEPVSPEAQLLCEAESREAAQKLAELYGITLVEYRNGLGRFYTEEDPNEVIRRGKENGWPELVRNGLSSPS